MSLHDIKHDGIKQWFQISENFTNYKIHYDFHDQYFKQHSGSILDRLSTVISPSKISNNEKHSVIKTSKFIYKINTDQEKQLKITNDKRYKFIMTEICSSMNQTIKSVARHVRRTLLKNHKKCKKEFLMFQGSLMSQDYIDVCCPFAYAYVMWRFNMERFKRFTDVDHGRLASKDILRITFPYCSSDKYLYKLISNFEEVFENDPVQKSVAAYKWIFNKILGQLIIEDLKNWLKYVQFFIDNKSIVEFIPKESKKISFFTWVLPLKQNEPIEFHLWNEWGSIRECSNSLECHLNSEVIARMRKQRMEYLDNLRKFENKDFSVKSGFEIENKDFSVKTTSTFLSMYIFGQTRTSLGGYPQV